jgi:metal-responsive CopG/Arc/MetJ family transcriptional regulator
MKPLKKGVKSQQLNIMLPEDMHKKLESAAKEEGFRFKSDYVRNLIRSALKKLRSKK